MFMTLEVTTTLHCLCHKTCQVHACISYFIVGKLKVFIKNL